FEPLDLDAMQFLAGLEVADLETKKFVDVDEAERLRAIDREWSNGRGEWSDVLHDLVGLGISDREEWRLETGQIHARTVQITDGVVGAALCLDACDDIAGAGVHDVPDVLLE